MKKSISILFLMVALTLLSLHSTAAIPVSSEVLRLDNTQGLSSQKVYSFVEDQDGAIWIGTKAGVDRYNGRKLKNYLLENGIYYGDKAGRIIRLYENSGTLYAYDTSGSIYMYSPDLDEFELVQKLNEDLNADITLRRFMCNDNTVLYALNTGLYRSINGGRMKPILPEVNVNDVIMYDDYIIAGTSSGVKLLQNDMTVNSLEPFKDMDIYSLYVDSIRNSLYVGTFNKGLYKVDLSNLNVTPIHPENSLLSKPVRSIVKLNDNQLAIGIDGSGVLLLNQPDDNIECMVNTELNPDYSFTGNGIYSLLTDSNGNLWIGSYTGGVTMLSFSSSPIQLITQKKNDANSLANNNVNDIIENIDGKIWFATDRGISIYNPVNTTWANIIKDAVVVTLCHNSDGEVYAGCYGDGIYVIEKDGSIKDHWLRDKVHFSSNYIFAIELDLQNNLWIGSPHGLLTELDSNGQLLRNYEIDNVISLVRINANEMGVATVNGFYIIDTVSESYNWYASAHEQIEHDVSAYIISLWFNDDNTVWLGTEAGGLNLYSIPSRKIIRELKTSNGLPSNDIAALEKDDQGRLWVSTGNGIAIVSDSIISSLNFITGVTKEYNKSAVLKMKNGKMIFGSTAGAVVVNPNNVNIIDYPATLRIINFDIEGIRQEENHSKKPEFSRMISEGRIILPHNYNSFDIEFEAINIPFRDDIQYQYMLYQYDHDWSDISPEGTARYRNVPSGEYTLDIRAVRKSDGQIIDHRELEILIKAPWWNTIWAKILYALLILGIIYFIIRYKWYQLRKEHDEDKIRFFINTAHDIRTPLSLVMAPIEDLRKESKLSDNAHYLLDVAAANIKKLNAVTSQLLDFEKIDSKKTKVRFEPINLNFLLSEEVSCFNNICEQKGIKLQLNVPDESVVISADRHLLELMLDNLLSNACKYTGSGGIVEVALEGNRNKATINIIDNGIGIPMKEQKNIFTNVYRAENARATQETGNGFGLLQVRRIVELLHGNIKFNSKEGEGTTFTINFKRIYDEPAIQWNPSNLNNSIDEIRTPYQVNSQLPDDKDETLLIVEDNDDLRNYLISTFSNEYNVVATVSADDALIFLDSHYPDIILSDVMMPGLQGDEFCRIVKNNQATAGIPIILLTAKTTHDAIVAGLEKGADDYIAKPFSLDILKSKIKGMISNRKRIREYLLSQAVKKAERLQEAPAEQTDIVSEDENDVTKNLTQLSEADKKFVEDTTSIIIEHLGDSEFSIDRLCREMAMSRTLFFGRLKSLTGKGPQEFIRILRLERAAELLKNGLPVIEVAERTGFVNSKYFSTVFKKHYGVSPSKFNDSSTN